MEIIAGVGSGLFSSSEVINGMYELTFPFTEGFGKMRTGKFVDLFIGRFVNG